MGQKTQFHLYRPKTILNTHKHPDQWFWTKYTAHPYVGCQHGCYFCYSRETKYASYEDPEDFSRIIKAKENAAELLRQSLKRKPVDMVFTCDYQPVEQKYGLSRQILEVCLDLGFPVFVLERSPLVLKDLDLIQRINEKTPSIVAFSIISTPDSPNHEIVSNLENLAPAVEKRFEAMQQLEKAGIMTGTCFMPILPGLCDDDTNLEAVVRWTKQYGGRFVLAGGLTLADKQKDYFINHLKDTIPEIVGKYRYWYPAGSYGTAYYDWNRIARKIAKLCQDFKIYDRIPRPIIPGEKFALNKKIAEKLANDCYYMEINGEPKNRLWMYRKAAWAVEGLDIDISLVYQSMGIKGINMINDIDDETGKEVEKILQELWKKRDHEKC